LLDKTTSNPTCFNADSFKKNIRTFMPDHPVFPAIRRVESGSDENQLLAPVPVRLGPLRPAPLLIFSLVMTPLSRNAAASATNPPRPSSRKDRKPMSAGWSASPKNPFARSNPAGQSAVEQREKLSRARPAAPQTRSSRCHTRSCRERDTAAARRHRIRPTAPACPLP